MADNGPMVPNVWICLQKIKGYLDGDYTDEADVRTCITTLEKMFEYLKINVKAEGLEFRICRNGWPRDVGG
jgi:hypothetical protein